MKYLKMLCILSLVFVVCTASAKKEKEKHVYVFGMAASFSDSVVYFTDIQQMDSVKLKNSFLPKRDQYSKQLEDYVASHNLLQNGIGIVFFSESLKQLEKNAVQLMEKYMNNEKVRVEKIEPDRFRFTRPED